MPLPFQPKPLDADAAAYIARSGATDRAAISAFVRGVKALGLWNNMVCWPLRSSQNAGNGDTVYSLGGLGTFNGTLVNGPAWGTSGIEFTSTTHQITRSGFDTPPSPMTFGMVNDKSNTAASLRLTGLGAFPKRYFSSDAINSRSFDIRNSGNGQLYLWTPSVSTGFIYKSVSITGNKTADGYVNGSAVSPSVTNLGAAGWNDAEGDSTLLLYGSIASDATIRAAFYYVLRDASATASQQSALYTLYKSTLGQGLGLP